MQVFAEYIRDNNINYRRTTLLQFGNSWDLIGSAVLKNPGSANNLTNISNENLKSINKYFEKEDLKYEDWFNFTKDPTMDALSKVFNGYYVGKEKELNGVIQLFNLYCIKDQDIQNAREKLVNNQSKYLSQKAEEIIPHFKDKPIFLGWFSEYKLNSELNKKANKIFDFISNSGNNYLNPIITNNNFYHPLYINRSYNKPIVREPLIKFHELMQ